MTKDEIKKIKSFFLNIENTRGFDVTSEIGEIANEAYHHWILVERKDRKIELLNKELQLFEDSEKRYKNENKDKLNLICDLQKKIKSLNDFINNLAIKIIHKKKNIEHENTSNTKPHKLIDEFKQMKNCPYKDDWHYCCRCDKETFCKWADSPRKSKEAIKEHIQENWGK